MLVNWAKKQLRERFGYVTQADKDREWREYLRDKNNALREKMKPDDGQQGFMFDTDKPEGVVVALSKERLLEVYQNPKKDRENALSQSQIRFCAKAFNENNNMHLMITLCVNPDGEIRLIEGNHRLELLRQGSAETILANVINNNDYSDEEFDQSVVSLLEACGQPDALIEKNPDAVFCNVDLDANGHFVHTLEQRVTAPYFTISQTSTPAKKL